MIIIAPIFFSKKIPTKSEKRKISVKDNENLCLIEKVKGIFLTLFKEKPLSANSDIRGWRKRSPRSILMNEKKRLTTIIVEMSERIRGKLILY